MGTTVLLTTEQAKVRMENEEEQYISDIGLELEPVIELVGNWMERQNSENESEDCNNVEVLRKRLHKKESTIQMLAEVSAALLQLYNGEKAKKCEYNPEVDDLKEEVTQLHYRNNSLCEQVKKLENDLAEADHHEEDLIEHNKMLSSFSISCETQDKLKELEKDNTELSAQVSELHSELRLREDLLFEERAKMKKAIALLKQSLYSKEAEVTKLENDQKSFKTELRRLHGRLREVEIDAEGLREELAKSKLDLNVYKSMFEKSEREHAECRELLKDARCQLGIYKETNTKTKFLRHVQNPNSPYVDPDSVSCELERVFRDRERSGFDVSTSEYSSILTVNMFDDNGSLLCDDISDCNSEMDSVDGNVNYNLLVHYRLIMGQPGRPGTEDLELALKRLKQLQDWRASDENQPALPFHSHASPPRLPKRIQAEAESSAIVPSSAAMRHSAMHHSPPSTIRPRQKLFCEGLNAVSLISGSQSGVLIRGCEVPDVFVKVERSFSEIEEDDFDVTTTDYSSMEASLSIAQDISLSTESDSGWFESDDKSANRLSDVPTSESRTWLKNQNLSFSGGVRRRRNQGLVLHRTSPCARTSDVTTLQRDVDENQEATSENVLDDPKDCVVS